MISNFLKEAISGYRKTGDEKGELNAFRALEAWGEMVNRGEAHDIPVDSEAARLISSVMEIVPRKREKIANGRKRRGRGGAGKTTETESQTLAPGTQEGLPANQSLDEVS